MANEQPFEMSPDEKEVATYHCSTLSFPKCDGYLTVTNNRVVFHGWGRDSRIVQEVELQTVYGLNSFYGSKFNSSWFIMGLICALAALIFFIPSAWAEAYYDYSYSYRPSYQFFTFRNMIGVIFVLLSLYSFSRCRRRAFFLQIYSSQAAGSPIRVGSAPSGGIGSSAVFAIVAMPTQYTDDMMKELGAMIQDLKKLGDRGVERWKKKLYEPFGIEDDEEQN